VAQPGGGRMREMLCRGKRKDNREWAYGWLFRHKENYFILPLEASESEHLYLFDYAVEVFPETIGQFTGLTDKNGKKIFEGDILRWIDRTDYNCHLESLECPEEYEGWNFRFDTAVIVWGEELDYPAFDLSDHDFDCNGLSELINGDWFFEVIGNIHDNPELLKKESPHEAANFTGAKAN
jgi:uncharacterized phage protein (TIGR01671 family)